MNDTILRTTKSVCPKCLEQIDACLIEKDSCIFLQKSCKDHGNFDILLSRTPKLYKELDQFYFAISNNKATVPEYELWPTYRCNIDCTICCFGGQNHEMQYSEPTCADIEDFITEHSQNFYIISGGEPTCRDDLAEIIKTLKKHGKAVTINTNGLKLTDIQYLKKLADAGLDRVNLQFDGFNRQAYKELRRKDYLDAKLEVIENLRSMKIQTTFNATIARNLNEDAISELIDFAAKNDFINGVNFFTICFLGGARGWSDDKYIMPDEIVDLLEKQTNNIINKNNVYIFQKLHLAIKAFLKHKWCFYNQSYLFVRVKESYKPIDRFLNFELAEPWLNKYAKAYKSSGALSSIYLSIAIFSLFLNIRSVFIIKEILIKSISYFFKTNKYLKGNKFFSVSFSTGCDPYKFDESIVQNCQNEIIAPSEETESLVNIGSDGLYNMSLEKRHLNKIHSKNRINNN
ncbi:MAG: radical SAM protein [Candidatus Omnitrophica bacterium]|nr:radical SAM protein [Candidatus Omnitrophota bacterium]MBU1996687.1 radical SAM protein [Candidatus Omnitrophota bacterium]MBU4333584.1 radical SAM protein [Candidatus Omnitrophota bacterium]